MRRMSRLTNITIRGLQALSTYLTKYIADRCVHPNPFLIYPEDRSLSACRTETFITALLTEAWDAISDASETSNNCAYHHNIKLLCCYSTIAQSFGSIRNLHLHLQVCLSCLLTIAQSALQTVALSKGE